MASLPIYSDRYAGLKPRRNALREKIDPKWREALGYVPKHRPMFTRLPEHPRQRWRLFAEFTEIWLNSRQRTGRVSEETLTAIEQRERIQLPSALREWYTLAGENGEPPTFRRYFAPHLMSPGDVGTLREENSVAFYIDRGDNPRGYGVPISDLRFDDPPVYELRPQFRRECRSITEFALRMLIVETLHDPDPTSVVFYLARPSLELLREIEHQYQRCGFSDSARFDSFRAYEGEELVLLMYRQDPWYSIHGAARTRDAWLTCNERLRNEVRASRVS